MPRRLAQELRRAQRVHRVQPVQVPFGVPAVLIGREAAHAFLDHVQGNRGIGAPGARQQIFHALGDGKLGCRLVEHGISIKANGATDDPAWNRGFPLLLPA